MEKREIIREGEVFTTYVFQWNELDEWLKVSHLSSTNVMVYLLREDGKVAVHSGMHLTEADRLQLLKESDEALEQIRLELGFDEDWNKIK